MVNFKSNRFVLEEQLLTMSQDILNLNFKSDFIKPDAENQDSSIWEDLISVWE